MIFFTFEKVMIKKKHSLLRVLIYIEVLKLNLG